MSQIHGAPAAPGMLLFSVLASAVLALPASLLLLRMYRHAVLRGMNALANHDATRSSASKTSPARSPAVALHATVNDPRSGPDDGALRRAARGAWRTASVYFRAGLVYAVVMSVAALAIDGLGGNWRQMAVLMWAYAWPAVAALILVAAYDRRRRLQILCAYAAVGIALTVTITARNSPADAVRIWEAWLLMDGPGTILLATFLWRPVRAVGPMVLAFLLVASIGVQTILWVASTNDTVLRAAADSGRALGLQANGVFYGLVLVGMLAFGAGIGWPILQWIGRRYDAKKFSDQIMTVDSMFLVFAILQSLSTAAAHGMWCLSGGAVAFAGYKAATILLFRGGRREISNRRTLLLLRVFRLGKREASLFDRLRRHWQPVGAIRMIAGPDLVTALIEPHEFLRFLAGRLDRQFVSGAGDLAARINALDDAADPDGRHRVTEFFCHADTWQQTMQTLASMTDVVLMDLRGFSSQNEGCHYEIGSLVNAVDVDRVLFLVDETTDEGALQATLQQLWRKLPADSPNRRLPSADVRLFRVERQSESEMIRLVGELCGNPGAPYRPAPARQPS